MAHTAGVSVPRASLLALPLVRLLFGDVMLLRRTLSTLFLGLTLSACGGGGDPAPPKPKTLGEAIDAMASAAMANSRASAVSVSVISAGKTVHEKGYGYSDAARSIALPADALFRTAGIVKPVTAARVQQLAFEGKLALTDHVFCTGDNSPCWLPAAMLPPAHDSRVRDITLKDLINHAGGWNRERSGDAYGSEIDVVRSLGLARAPTRAELIRFIMARPLDTAPGQSVAYSNFGYLLLSEVIERAGGEAYVAQIQRDVFAPIGIGAEEFKAARSLAADRDAREPYYASDRMVPGVFSGGQARLAKDEFAVLENWVGAGGAIVTAHAMASFAAHYRIPDGLPIREIKKDFGHTGGFDGSATISVQLASGTSYAILINTSIGSDSYNTLISDMNKLLHSYGY
jgi:CubicO group peptidase (beta-lactamase class C family)